MALEGRAALGRQVTRGIVGIGTFEEEVLGIGTGVGDAPGDPAVGPHHDHGDAGQGGAGHGEAGSVQVGEIPDRRHREPQMRVVGQHRQAACRMAAVDHPVVRAVARLGQQVEQGLRPVAGGQPGRVENHRGVGRVCGEEAGGPFGAQQVDQAGAQRFLAPVAREMQRHHLQPGDAVGRPPGLGIVGQQQGEFGRQGALVAGDIGVDAGGIGLQCRQGLRIECGDTLLCRPVEPQGAQETVEGQGRGAQHLRKAPLGRAALLFHLEQAVLGMGESQAEVGVLGRFGQDVGDAPGTAQDLDRCGRSVQGDRAVDRRHRPAQPARQDARAQHQEQQGEAERAPKNSKAGSSFPYFFHIVKRKS